METLGQGRFLQLVRDGRWEYCDRVKGMGAVMVFSCTPGGAILLVEEYRTAIGCRCVCFPAGLSGDEGPESDAEAARRELREEAGYEAEKVEFLFKGPSSPGMASEMVSYFRATGLHRVGQGGGIEGEDITVREVPREEIDDWLAAQEAAGVAIDPRVYTGLYFLGIPCRR